MSPEACRTLIASVVIYGGGRRIRTSEVVRRQIYSLFPLATRESLQVKISHFYSWSWRWDSNPQPADYKSAALPIELRQRKISIYNKFAAGSSGSDKKTEVLFINHLEDGVNDFFVFCEGNLLRYSDFFVLREEIHGLLEKASAVDSQYIV